MNRPADAFDDIPGTVHFNGERLRQGYQLNKFLLSLLAADARKAFKADEAAYLQKFKMTPQQREAVLKREWARMVDLGANIFCIVKLTNCDGIPMPHVNAIMTGMSYKDYEDMMNAGGRSMDGIRSKKETKIG
jgi:protocatechuate 4,5-dioxygenase alpha chain